jgi:hypothetical protein
VWGKRRKRRAQLSRQLALGLLEDAMGRVQQQERDDDEDDPPPLEQELPAQRTGENSHHGTFGLKKSFPTSENLQRALS